MKIAVWPGDERQMYIAEGLTSIHEYSVIVGKEQISQSDILILPIPFSKLNNRISDLSSQLHPGHIVISAAFPEYFIKICEEGGIKCIDLNKYEIFKLYNSIATAEGAICCAIRAGKNNLCSKNVLVAGFGRCGKLICDRLYGFKARTDVLVRSEVSMAEAKCMGFNAYKKEEILNHAEEYDYIFNTVPNCVFDREFLLRVNKECVIIDIASGNGGVDYEAAAEFGINAAVYTGIPGIYSPKESAEIIIGIIRQLIGISDPEDAYVD